MHLFLRVLWFIAKYILSVLLLIYLISIGILTRKGRLFITEILDFYNFTFITKTINPLLEKISYNALIPNNLIDIIEPRTEKGNVSLDELVIINGIIKNNKPKKIFEIGTFDGRTTMNMAFSSEDNCDIYTLDLPKEQLNKTKYEVSDVDKTLVDKEICGKRIIEGDSRYKGKITQLYGDSGNFDFTPFYNSIELVFIDGAHDYNNALNDSETALKLIGNNNGIILWHDYKENVPVVKAIETFRHRHPGLEIYHIIMGTELETSLAYCKIHSK